MSGAAFYKHATLYYATGIQSAFDVVPESDRVQYQRRLIEGSPGAESKIVRSLAAHRCKLDGDIYHDSEGSMTNQRAPCKAK